MPYKLRKAPKRDLYWVVNKEDGRKFSKDPLPKETAKRQMKALYASEKGYKMKGGMKVPPSQVSGGLPIFQDEATGLENSVKSYMNYIKLLHYIVLSAKNLLSRATEDKFEPEEWEQLELGILNLRRLLKEIEDSGVEERYTSIYKNLKKMDSSLPLPLETRNEIVGLEEKIVQLQKAYKVVLQKVYSFRPPAPAPAPAPEADGGEDHKEADGEADGGTPSSMGSPKSPKSPKPSAPAGTTTATGERTRNTARAIALRTKKTQVKLEPSEEEELEDLTKKGYGKNLLGKGRFSSECFFDEL